MTARVRVYASVKLPALRSGLALSLCVAILGTFWPALARADLFDAQTVQNSTGSSQSAMNLVFAGNVIGAIDDTVNPFAGGSTSIAFDSVSNTTTVEFSGGTAVPNNASATYGISFNDSGFQIEDAYWSAESDAFPALSVSTSLISVTGPIYFGLFYTQLAFASDPSETEDVYEELPMPGGCGEFELTDEYTNPFHLPDPISSFNSAVGGSWITSPIPLDELNPTDTPPTGPIFWPVSTPPALTVEGSYDETVCVPDTPPLLAIMLSVITLAGARAGRITMRLES